MLQKWPESWPIRPQSDLLLGLNNSRRSLFSFLSKGEFFEFLVLNKISIGFPFPPRAHWKIICWIKAITRSIGLFSTWWWRKSPLHVDFSFGHVGMPNWAREFIVGIKNLRANCKPPVRAAWRGINYRSFVVSITICSQAFEWVGTSSISIKCDGNRFKVAFACCLQRMLLLFPLIAGEWVLGQLWVTKLQMIPVVLVLQGVQVV